VPNYPSYSRDAFDAPEADAEVLRSAVMLLKMHGFGEGKQSGTCYYTLDGPSGFRPSAKPFVVNLHGYPTRRYKTAEAMMKGLGRILARIQVREYENA